MTNYGYLKDKDGNRLAIEDAYGYMKTSGDQTLDGSMTITGNLRLKGTSNYGNKLSFGDSDYVYLSEPSDDLLEIHASKGIILGEYSTSEKAVGKWIDGKTIYQKVIYHSGDGESYAVSTGISNMDWLVDAYGVAKMNDSIFLPLNFYNAGGWNTFHVIESGAKIQMQRGQSYAYQYWYVILEYTKK